MAGLLFEDKYYALSEIYQFSLDGLPISLSDAVKEKVQASRTILSHAVKSGKIIYGVNTGFGKLSQVKIPTEKITILQKNLLLSHAAGVGCLASDQIVYLMLILKILSLSKGYSGVRLLLIEKLLEFLNKGCLPAVPVQGSVGASGDLAPLSHMSLPLIGEGKIKYNGAVHSAALIMKELDINPVKLDYKEGLALINGTQFSTAYGVLCMARLQNILKIADISGAVSTEGLLGTDSAFLAKVQKIKPHSGQRDSADNIYRLLQESEIHTSHIDCDRVQDMYSLRCIPQVHGACRDSITAAAKMIEIEINSVSDNPLVFPDGDVISAGNFHAASTGQAMDIAAIAATELGNISERRIFALTKGDFGLPAFLTEEPGIRSGFMMGQVTAASLASENKGLSHPATIDNIPTGADQEDHVSMAPWAGRKLFQIIQNLEYIFAIEILCACQAIEFRKGLKPGRGVLLAFNLIRKHIPKITEDRILKDDFELAADLIISGELIDAIENEFKLK